MGDLDVDLLRVSRELGFLCQGRLLVCLQPGLGFFAFPYLFVADCGLRRDAQRFGGVHHGASAGKSRELRGQLTGRRFFLTGSSALLYFAGFVAFGKLTGSSPVLTGSSFFLPGSSSVSSGRCRFSGRRAHAGRGMQEIAARAGVPADYISWTRRPRSDELARVALR